MGRIKRFNLAKFINLVKAEYFFETGTWKGDGLAYAKKYPFKKIYSSEIIPTVAQQATKRFKNDKRVIIINDDSISTLKNHIDEIKGNCIYWLDAHFPGAEEGLNDYNEFQNELIKLPLQKELEIISSRKHFYRDIIIIDDLRIYETGTYESGNLPENVLPPSVRSTNFVYDLFKDTHTINKSLKDEGYIYLIPISTDHLRRLPTFIYAAENWLFKKII